MATEVVMPRLDWSSETVSLVAWAKRDGDEVRAGEILVTVEGDKAAVEVEAMDSGILRIPPDSPAPGVEVPVGTVIAYVVQPGEPAPFESPAAPAAGADVAAPSPDGADGSRAAPVPEATPAPGPAGAPSSSPASVQAPERGAEPRISPRARRVARELGVDWSSLRGSGISGRIVERDVRSALASAAPRPPEAAAPAGAAARAPGEASAPATETPAGATREAPPPAADTSVAFAGIRRLIASRMRESLQTAAPVTLTTDADATELARLRAQIKADLAGTGGRVPTYDDLFVRIVAVALKHHPELNASLSGAAIVRHAAVHVGVAVDTDRGLLVPVVRDAHRRSIQEIAEESARLVAAARAGTLPPDAMRGGTFTITNLGMYEIDAFTPIINLPECAILGLGRIVARQVVVDEDAEVVAIRKMIALSLTFDHRLVDGAPAARFLQQVKRWIEQPYAWLTA